jgi:tRNA dimethylallyltransferase
LNFLDKTIIVVAGPTAVGKTAMAIRLALHYNCSILSADSRQCYRELDIGVAKPTAAELATVPHYFINSHSIHQKVDVAIYEQYALETLEKLFSEKDVVILVGGTGLYIKALCEGIDQMPEIPPATRQQVREGFYREGLPWLQKQIEVRDPVYYSSGEMKNPHRLMRALEFILATGESIKTYQKGKPVSRPFNIIKTGLELPREVLIERIHLRVDKMMKEGLAEEVKTFLPFQNLQALQTVGYRELIEHFNGLSSMDAAVEFIKTNTRQYAKRQLTWFKKDMGIKWFSPGETDAIIEYSESVLNAMKMPEIRS